MTTPFHPPLKRSVEIAGHKTSISLEPLFWDLLTRAAAEEGLPINALVGQIDAARIVAPTPPGLAGAIRCWLAARALPDHPLPDHPLPDRTLPDRPLPDRTPDQ